MNLAVYGGSFDPITNGHMCVIRGVADIFDQLIVAVACNPTKKYHFDLDTRVRLVKAACIGIQNLEVREIGNEFLASWAYKQDAHYLVRGIRSAEDYAYEYTLLRMNERIEPAVRTVFIVPPPSQEIVSSSLVRSLIGPRGWRRHVAPFVPKAVYDKLVDDFAVEKFCSLFEADVSRVALDLVQRYREPHRRYHTIEHVLDCIEWCEHTRPCLGLALALWFHDAIYDPQRSDNEAQSAKLAESALTGLISYASVSRICAAIMKTSHGASSPVGDIEKLVLDIDLSILGAASEDYQRYCAGIRYEYAWAPSSTFSAKRTEILLGFLARDKIFLTPEFAHLEQTAHTNIKNEIERLK